MAVGTMYNIQRSLSEAQAFPVVGPLVVSPIKAVVSVAHLIVGLAGSILFGTFAILSGNKTLSKMAFKSFAHTGLGLVGLAYSVGNFLTLGILAYKIEILTVKPATS